MWEFELEHSPQGKQEYGNIFRGVGDVMCITQMHRSQLVQCSILNHNR
jgi:hypothetical protein